MKVSYKTTQRIKESLTVVNDPLYLQLTNMTLQQIDDWIDTNVTNLTEAKNVLKIFAKILIFLVKHKIKVEG